MARISRCFPLARFAACVLALAWGLSGWSRQGKLNPAQEKPAEPLKPFYFGVSVCKGCHTKVPEGEILPLVCECNEYTTWITEDKHGQAYQMLSDALGKRMGDRLKKEVTRPETGCIACHGIAISEEQKKVYADKSFNVADGVSCVVCHGARRDWVELHQLNTRREEWRNLTRQQKYEMKGMTDLWSPVPRAKTCVSCHIGSVTKDKAQTKFVTHEMYAAGHPPLPGIEVGTFSEHMPRHWKYINEKDTEVQKILRFEPGAERFERTKLVMVSSVVSLAESLRLLSAQAKEVASAKTGTLDFAHFDCYACHHDLKSKSWRQERGYVGKPGRPQMRPWPTLLARLSLEEANKTAGGVKELEDRLKRLYEAFDAEPFGDCERIGPAAEELATWLTNSAKKLADEPTPKYEARAPELLALLCSTAKKSILNYDSAREIAWAFEIIHKEWNGWKPTDPENPDIKALHEYLKLDLPSGRIKKIVEELPKSLKTLNDYDPDEFKKHMEKLSRLVPQK
jgi:hypothetical protein